MKIRLVSRHAITRFRQRICATDYPVPILLDCWQDGELATDEIMTLFRQTRHDGNEYRIATYNSVRFIMIARNNCMVTLVTLAVAHPDSGRWKLGQRDKDRKRRREIDTKFRRSNSKSFRFEDEDSDK